MEDELFKFRKNAIQGALTEPLCADYRHEWQRIGSDKERLVGFALRQQSIPFFAHYCYNGKGVSKDYIKSAFNKYINGYTVYDADGVDGYTYGLYVDYDYDNELVIDKDITHIMWTCGAEIVIPQTKCPVIYVSNKSSVDISCEGYNSVKIYLFDESIVNVEDVDVNSDVVIYKYGDKCRVTYGGLCFGKTNEFNKDMRL